jgi:hypothetical protein
LQYADFPNTVLILDTDTPIDVLDPTRYLKSPNLLPELKQTNQPNAKSNHPKCQCEAKHPTQTIQKQQKNQARPLHRSIDRSVNRSIARTLGRSIDRVAVDCVVSLREALRKCSANAQLYAFWNIPR